MPETPEQRSRTMRAVKGRDTAPELFVRRLLYSQSFRYRLHGCNLPGKPDIVFPGRRKIIFVHGCFWHAHTCTHGARKPKANSAYWLAKLEKNRKRDTEILRLLTASGWQVLVLWECQLKCADLLDRLIIFLS